MRSLQSILLVLIFVFAASSIGAQKKFNVQIYNDENGLSQNTAKGVVKDQLGFIWICTENGINRFDGRRFDNFIGADFGLKSNRFSHFSGVGDSIIYAETLQGEFIEIYKNQIRKISNPPAQFYHRPKNNEFNILGLPRKFNTYFLEELFLVKNNKVKYHIHKNTLQEITGKDTAFYDLKNIIPKELFILRDWVYIVAENGDYAAIKNGEIYFYSFTTKNEFNHENIVWNRVNDQAFIRHPEGFYYIIPDKKGKLILTIVSGELDWSRLGVRNAYYDENNHILFLSSNTSGLLVIKEKQFDVLPLSDQVPNIFYNLYSPDGEIIVTALGGWIDSDLNFHKYGEISLNNRFLKYWGGDSIYLRINKNTITKFKLNKSGKETILAEYTDKNPFALHIDSINEILLSGLELELDSGYIVYHDLTKFKEKKRVLVPFSPYLFYQLDSVNYIIGAHNGLFHYNIKTEEFYEYTEHNFGLIRSIQEFDDQHLGISTYGQGYYIYDGGSFTRMPLDKKGYLRFSHYFVFDKKDFVWIPTNRGLFRFYKNDILRYAKGERKDSPYFQYFDKSDGFITNEFNGCGGPCYTRLNNGKTVLPTLVGLVFANLEDIPSELNDTNIFFTNGIYDGIPLEIKPNTILPRNFNQFTFVVSFPDFSNPYSMNLEGRLEGDNTKDWSYLPEDGLVRFYTMAPGEYTYLVRRRMGFNGEEKIYSFQFTIPMPWWKTNWFFALFVILLILTGYIISRLALRILRHQNKLLENRVIEQTGQLNALIADLKALHKNEEKINRERKRTISILGHDVRTPLNYLSMISSELLASEHVTHSAVREDLTIMKETSDQLFKYVLEILKHNESLSGVEGFTTAFNLCDLTEKKLAIFEGMARHKGVKLVNKVPSEFIVFANRNVLSIVLHNLIDNALKFSYSGKVEIEATKQDLRTCKICISDTGMGMTEAQIAKLRNKDVKTPDTNGKGIQTKLSGFGLPMVLQLVSLMGAEITVESALGKGTTICLIIPNQ
ncbi:MAG: HAMP domain-containing histidine kinase [Cryomorphaceae bacterium]|nr:HAMP domain-containing histidine kinase [Cryomorphaceae bacterium]